MRVLERKAIKYFEPILGAACEAAIVLVEAHIHNLVVTIYEAAGAARWFGDTRLPLMLLLVVRHISPLECFLELLITIAPNLLLLITISPLHLKISKNEN